MGRAIYGSAGAAGMVFALASGLFAPSLVAKKKVPLPDRSAEPTVLNPPVLQMPPDRKVLHALNRLTFGPRPGDADEIARQGLGEWIERQLNPESIAENPVLETKLALLDTLRLSSSELASRYPPRPAKPAPDSPAPPADPFDKLKPPEAVALLEAMPPDERQGVLEAMPPGRRQRLIPDAPPELRRAIQLFNGPIQLVNQDLAEGKLLRAVYGNRQLEEVLTDFWFNHFNVYLDKGADRYMVTAYERDTIRPRVFGKFEDLLLATAESPAMLFYLDNWQSQGRGRKGLNENYGRELMELHTLGVDGGYTQQDVTEVARCFTGWTIREPRQGGGFEYNDKQHDKGEKTVLGVTIPAGGGMGDGLKVIEILAHSPATAHFISRNLALRFVSDNPPEAIVAAMARKFLETDGDLREVMRAMLEAPEFWHPGNFAAKVKSPFEMVASALRGADAEIDYGTSLLGLLNQMGEPLYRKLEPTGYSNRGSDWLNSASLLARMNFAVSLSHNRIAGVKTRADVAPFLLSVGAPDFQRR